MQVLLDEMVDMRLPSLIEGHLVKTLWTGPQVMEPLQASHLMKAMVHSDLLSQTIHIALRKPPQETTATQGLNGPAKQTVLMKKLALYLYYLPRVKEKQISFSLLIALFGKALIQRQAIVETNSDKCNPESSMDVKATSKSK